MKWTLKKYTQTLYVIYIFIYIYYLCIDIIFISISTGVLTADSLPIDIFLSPISLWNSNNSRILTLITELIN